MASNLRSEITGHLRHLCAEIGPRPIGSPGNHAAASYIRGVFQAAGLEIEEQRFGCPAWHEEETCLELEGERLPSAANAYSRSCDVAVPTVAVGTVAELEAADLVGRLGILYGDLARAPLTPKGCTLYDHERDQKIVRLLEEKGPAALITVNPRIGCLERLIEDWNLAIPSATVPAEAGLALLERVGRPLRLRIVSRSAPGYSANLVGTKAGARPERIVLCAHYDTKVGTPGAMDNGSGVAALLALARMLARRELSASLEFVAFSAEEYGTSLDDTEYYVTRKGGEFGSILAAINLDGIGERLGTNTVALMAGSEPFRAQVVELLGEWPGVIWTEPWPESNHSTFARRGVPSVAISTRGFANIAHSPADTVDWISAEKLEEVVGLVVAIVEKLQDRPLAWTREAGPAGSQG